MPSGRLTVYTPSTRRALARKGVEETCNVAMEENTMVMVNMTRKVEKKFFIVMMMMMMMSSLNGTPYSCFIGDFSILAGLGVGVRVGSLVCHITWFRYIMCFTPYNTFRAWTLSKRYCCPSTLKRSEVFEHAPPRHGLNQACPLELLSISFEVWEAFSNLSCMLSASRTKCNPFYQFLTILCVRWKLPTHFPTK